MSSVVLDGESLTIEQLAQIARDPGTVVERDPATNERVERAGNLIREIAERYRRDYKLRAAVPATEYGVTTGFGEFKDKPIAPDDLEQLQRNLLLSHSVGVGDNTNPDDLTNYYPADVVRAALATRLNAFLKGNSGVRPKLVDIVQAMLNRGVIPLVPLRGSVGASGDLCPLSHLFVVLLGVGRFYTLDDAERRAGSQPAQDSQPARDGLESPSYVGKPKLRPAHELPDVLGFPREELLPTFKEGLALVNGVNFSAAMLALAVHDAERLAEIADTAAAMGLEALCGCTRALDAKVHDARGHAGAIRSAARMRELVEGSVLVERAGAVQDPYSLRCAPQVHGASLDTIAFARTVAEREINAATDNPLFFPDGDEPFDIRFRHNWPMTYRGDQRLAYSAGNFHGEPIALAADFLTIAIAELANISERRIQLLLDGHLNRRLPQNLTTRPGVNSGLMIAQYTAASLVSENKVLAHPASVDSIPTGANAEDHVSMSTWAARKMRSVVANAQAVLALELLVVAQALEWRIALEIDPNAPAHEMSIEEAEEQARAFEAGVSGRAQAIAMQVAPALRATYQRVRELAPPVTHDRALDEDVRRIREWVARA